MREWIVGRNPVWELLAAGRRQVFELRIAQGVRETEILDRIRAKAQERKILLSYPPREELDTLGDSHQGVALQAGAYPYVQAADLLRYPGAGGDPPFFLALDTLQDPQNLGSLLRTAEAVGVHGVLIPSKRAAQVTPAVVRASSGASEHLRIARSNLAAGLGALKKAGVFFLWAGAGGRGDTAVSGPAGRPNRPGGRQRKPGAASPGSGDMRSIGRDPYARECRIAERGGGRFRGPLRNFEGPKSGGVNGPTGKY